MRQCFGTAEYKRVPIKNGPEITRSSDILVRLKDAAAVECDSEDETSRWVHVYIARATRNWSAHYSPHEPGMESLHEFAPRMAQALLWTVFDAWIAVRNRHDGVA